MKKNLSAEIDKDVETIVEAFSKIGWSQEDTGYITKEFKGKEFGLSFSPDLLYYSEVHGKKGNQKRDPGYRVWIKGEFLGKNESEIIEKMDFLKEEFKKLPFQPFFDEDGYKGNFSRPKKNFQNRIGKEKVVYIENVESSFYLNPDYPEGYWENHVL